MAVSAARIEPVDFSELDDRPAHDKTSSRVFVGRVRGQLPPQLGMAMFVFKHGGVLKGEGVVLEIERCATGIACAQRQK